MLRSEGRKELGQGWECPGLGKLDWGGGGGGQGYGEREALVPTQELLELLQATREGEPQGRDGCQKEGLASGHGPRLPCQPRSPPRRGQQGTPASKAKEVQVSQATAVARPAGLCHWGRWAHGLYPAGSLQALASVTGSAGPGPQGSRLLMQQPCREKGSGVHTRAREEIQGAGLALPRAHEAGQASGSFGNLRSGETTHERRPRLWGK